MKTFVFPIFRYQILPISTLQSNLFISYEELVSKKNSFFEDAITSTETKYYSKGRELVTKVLHHTEQEILLRVGAPKKVQIHSKDFSKNTIEDYPSCLVYVNNHENKQLIAIQENKAAFSDAMTVARFMNKGLNEVLKRHKLTVYIQQIFDERDFWATIKKYEGSITSIRFDLLKPNMADISKNLSEDMKLFMASTNSHHLNLTLDAPQGEVLENINPENQAINGISTYSMEVGQIPTIKIKESTKRIKTVDSQITEHITETEITGLNNDELFNLIKKKLDR